MTYTPEKPAIAESSDQLRARIPGWGADLDPRDRPSVPMLQYRSDLTGAHWEFPERQPEKWPRERSIEHKFLTPVFGTSCPPSGLSGAIRRLAYARYSEGRAAHWLLLIVADRVNAVEAHVGSFIALRPDNPITETGVLSEFSRNGLKSRLGQKRADLVHHALDPIIVAGPWVAAAAGGFAAGRRGRRLRRRPQADRGARLTVSRSVPLSSRISWRAPGTGGCRGHDRRIGANPAGSGRECAEALIMPNGGAPRVR